MIKQFIFRFKWLMYKIQEQGEQAVATMMYLQPIINQYFVNNKSEIWLWSLMIHSKGHRFNGFINS